MGLLDRTPPGFYIVEIVLRDTQKGCLDRLSSLRKTIPFDISSPMVAANCEKRSLDTPEGFRILKPDALTHVCERETHSTSRPRVIVHAPNISRPA